MGSFQKLITKKTVKSPSGLILINSLWCGSIFLNMCGTHRYKFVIKSNPRLVCIWASSFFLFIFTFIPHPPKHQISSMVFRVGGREGFFWASANQEKPSVEASWGAWIFSEHSWSNTFLGFTRLSQSYWWALLPWISSIFFS